MKNVYTLICFLFLAQLSAQTNIQFSNPEIDGVLSGEYDPTLYSSGTVVDDPLTIFSNLQTQVSAVQLKDYLTTLTTFGNRNTGSDTLSTTFGIGAARNWVLQEFDDISAANDNRLLTGFLQFDLDICGMDKHKNVVGVLPGRNVDDPSFIIIEAHMDSRCEGVCDVDCQAEGAEDNGSGSVLVMELARVMSQFTFDHTILFMLTIGEEQGLFGAEALAKYSLDNNLSIKAVLNNDIIGGVICGETSSAPSCPGVGLVDSTQVRLFSASGSFSLHKGLARFVKLQYQEELLDQVLVPMQITIMSAEDRAGRGGDHIPFRSAGFAAMRFTAAHEHGDASNVPGYSDHQHTSADVLGEDTDGDQVIDSFFVDFNYLSRNAVINGVAAAAAASGPETPDFSAAESFGKINIEIIDPFDYGQYRIGLRSTSNEFDTLITLTNATEVVIDGADIFNYISVAAVDGKGVESLFAKEQQVILLPNGTSDLPNEQKEFSNVTLLPNRPNPFDEATIISWVVLEEQQYTSANLTVRDFSGKLVKSFPIELKQGTNELLYTHGYGTVGTFVYSIEADGSILASRQMIYAN